jgi:hypothetical protein
MVMELAVTQKKGPRCGYPVVEISREVFEKLNVWALAPAFRKDLSIAARANSLENKGALACS